MITVDHALDPIIISAMNVLKMPTSMMTQPSILMESVNVFAYLTTMMMPAIVTTMTALALITVLRVQDLNHGNVLYAGITLM